MQGLLEDWKETLSLKREVTEDYKAGLCSVNENVWAVVMSVSQRSTCFAMAVNTASHFVPW